MSIEELNANTFNETIAVRQKKIAEGSTEKLPSEYPVNILAKRLHPNRQYMTVSSIKDLDAETKVFRFVPDPARGTTECAYFKAGQYLNVFVNINGINANRAYSISSSPKDSEEGFYEITVKRVGGGLVSNYISNEWKEGDAVEISAPSGTFMYSSIRDPKYILAAAGGSGITPFLSMARAIAEGDEDFDLTILYGSRTEGMILYKDEFDALAKKCDKVHVVYVLSDEEKDGFEHGFISEELIRKYAPADEEYSLFMSGPQAMYRFLEKVTDSMGLARRNVRRELFGEVHDPKTLENYPGTDYETVKITVSIRDTTKTVEGSVNDTIVQILEKNGIAVPTRCRSGECGFCHSLLVSGNVYVPSSVDGRRASDLKFGYLHPCVTFPLSDLEIIVPADK